MSSHIVHKHNDDKEPTMANISKNDSLTESDIEQLAATAEMLEALFDAGWQPDAKGREILRSFQRAVDSGLQIEKR